MMSSITTSTSPRTGQFRSTQNRIPMYNMQIKSCRHSDIPSITVLKIKQNKKSISHTYGVQSLSLNQYSSPRGFLLLTHLFILLSTHHRRLILSREIMEFGSVWLILYTLHVSCPSLQSLYGSVNISILLFNLQSLIH